MRVESWKESMVVPSSGMVSSIGFCGSGINIVEHLTYQSVVLCYRRRHLPSLKGLEGLGKKEFKALNGWLEKWKNQHHLAQRNVASEEGNVNDDTVCSWMQRVKELT